MDEIEILWGGDASDETIRSAVRVCVERFYASPCEKPGVVCQARVWSKRGEVAAVEIRSDRSVAHYRPDGSALKWPCSSPRLNSYEKPRRRLAT